MSEAMLRAHEALDNLDEPDDDLKEAIRSNLPAIVDPAKAFLPVPMAVLREAAEMIAFAPGLAPQFAEPKNCLAVAYQAARWKMDPIAVASKAYFTAGKGGGVVRIGYEAQLLHALILANAPLRGRPTIEYGYGGNGQKTAANRFCKVTGHFIGDDRPVFVISPTVAQIKVRNSPLWVSDPDQQLAYYTTRSFARRFCPDVLMGVYSRDEIETLRVIDYENRPPRNLFDEDEPQDAEFEDVDGPPPPTDADMRAFEQGGDSRDPRDDPRNRPQAPGGPPQGAVEPEDLPEARAWLAEAQGRLLGLKDPAAVRDQWNAVVADKRFGRLKSYDQGVTRAAQLSITGHVKKLENPEAEG